jgi:putative addiction module component (TIGR02574 family)
MTQNDLLAAIEALPKELQFALATSVLDRLAAEGPSPVSEQLKTEFLRREHAFFTDPDKGKAWDAVREELFEK